MKSNTLKILILLSMFALSAICAEAQIEASTPSGRPSQKQEDLPKGIKETMVKHKIDQAKKDHREMIENSEEAVKLSEELENSYNKNNSLSGEDRKKLERLEKLLKKIRKELGGDDDDARETEIDEEKPSTIVSALKNLQTAATNLFDELKKTSRFSISAVAIQSSNSILKLVRFLRFSK